MSIFQALVLGIVQGLTEYIPVSSTAHLILVPWLLGWNFSQETKFVFDVLVQWGTLVGVMIYFWRDIVADSSRRRQRPASAETVRHTRSADGLAGRDRDDSGRHRGRALQEVHLSSCTACTSSLRLC